MWKLGSFVFILGFSFSAFAYETDQYTVPPGPLADMGTDLSSFVWLRIDRGIKKVNEDLVQLPIEIDRLQTEMKAMKESSPGSGAVPEEIRQPYEYDSRKLKQLQERYRQTQSIEGIVSLLHDEFGGQVTWQEQRDGVFGLPVGYWNYPDQIKDGKPVAFRQGKFDNIYSFSGFHRLVSPTYFVFASTIRAYNQYFGVDKIGHLLNQGFEYYEIFNQSLKAGASEDVAQTKAVTWGIDSEDGIFGRLVDGVYSNGDLAANFAGFYFFKNLFSPINVNGASLPPQIIRNDDGTIHWNSDARTKDDFLKPFISEHLDESLNPSVLESLQRGIVKNAIISRCENWKSFRGFKTREKFLQITDHLNVWSNQDYGFRSENSLRIEDLCWQP